MARWFCGVPSVWELFSAPLIPERCYFSATITRAELEHRGVVVFDNESACRWASLRRSADLFSLGAGCPGCGQTGTGRIQPAQASQRAQPSLCLARASLLSPPLPPRPCAQPPQTQ